jgi:hypothetical protein
MNAEAALLSAFAALKAVHAAAVVTIAVQVDANTTVTTTGLRTNTTIARAIQKGGLSNNTDLGVWVLASVFTDITTLPGKTATITDAAGVVTSGRLLPVRLHALGGLVNLAIGEYDRVVA